MYKYIDENTPYEVTSKIMVHSRLIEIDKIAEEIGKKDEKSKVINLA